MAKGYGFRPNNPDKQPYRGNWLTGHPGFPDADGIYRQGVNQWVYEPTDDGGEERVELTTCPVCQLTYPYKDPDSLFGFLSPFPDACPKCTGQIQ